VRFTEFTGTARLDRRTKRLVKRLCPDDIAIIDHTDLDRVSAEELAESGVRIVFNVADSASGRYPNPGPLALVRAGVVLHVQEARVAEALEGFAENTMRFLRDEGKLLAQGLELPQLRTRFRDRHALVVARGPDATRDLRIVRPYIRNFKPVLVGVDGGADKLIEAGYRPDVIVGDMDSVSDEALGSGAELVVHAYSDGRAPGLERLERIGLASVVVPVPGISEDVAMLLAYEKGAELIVAVGTHFNLVEFLERNRLGMSSTFVTRLRVGGKLVDARGVSQLFRSRVGLGPLIAFGLAGLTAVVTAVAASPELRHLISLLGSRIRSLLGLD
jgi:uncharacterized membrane-anchored protein